MTDITKTIFFENANGTPEDRYVGIPSFVGERRKLYGFPVVVTQIIEVGTENQLVILNSIYSQQALDL